MCVALQPAMGLTLTPAPSNRLPGKSDGAALCAAAGWITDPLSSAAARCLLLYYLQASIYMELHGGNVDFKWVTLSVCRCC